MTTEVLTGKAAVAELLKALLDGATIEDAAAADSESHEACNCTGCQVLRFKVPTNPLLTSEEGADATIAALKQMIKLGNKAIQKLKAWQHEALMNPLPAEAELVHQQFWFEHLRVVAKTEAALNALLPEDRRAPYDALHTKDAKTLTVAVMGKILADARVDTQVAWDKRARQVAADTAIDTAIQSNAPEASEAPKDTADANAG